MYACMKQRRNEGFFMCLRPLLLKLCSIPVMVGPLAGLYFLGYQPPANYVIQRQNDNVCMYVCMHVYMYVIYICLYVRMDVCMNVYVYV